MGIVVYENSISLDGFVAGPNDSPENGMGDGGMRLFDWYQQGDVEVPLPGSDMVFRVSQASAAFMQADDSVTDCAKRPETFAPTASFCDELPSYTGW